MDFVDLDRHFVALQKDKEATVEWTPSWGRRYGGWLNWEQLVLHRRVALLAEALSGKTEELEHRVRVLKEQGKAAFFVRIEDLADRGFKAALDESELQLFEGWKNSSLGDAWFFLDSVDEARLNRKNFANALKIFRTELGSVNLNRSYVVVTCRASDWKGKADATALQNGLPFTEIPAAEPLKDFDEELLAPMFNEGRSNRENSRDEANTRPSDLLVVQLLPLTNAQKKLLAESFGASGETFLNAVLQSGLETMSERPGDLVDLLTYWNEYKSFGPLKDMMAHSVARKLRELNPERGASGILSPEMARQGAERIAGALVLAKTFSIRAPTQEPDPSLSRGAIDAESVLHDWTPEQVAALLRTGLFAPSTYGRIKFHHRSTQEYLAARWLLSLMVDANLPYIEVRDLVFAERYGIKTAVPSLLPVTAWLSLWNEQVRNELIRREPVALIAHGDPKSLPRFAKEALLDSYAALDVIGNLDTDHIDYRAAWMFSEPDLGPAIRRAWQTNDRPSFRFHLLQFIAEGKIASCTDLLRQVATSSRSERYARVVAVEGLADIGDQGGLKAVTKKIRSDPALFDARVAPRIALKLYPTHLSTGDLLGLISNTPSPEPYSSEGFSSHLAALHRQAQTRNEKVAFVNGIAKLVRNPQIEEEDPEETSVKHVDLCKGLSDLLLIELEAASGSLATPDVLDLLMLVERVTRSGDDAESIEALRSAVRANQQVNRQLMWADEAQHRRNFGARIGAAIRPWQVGPHTGRLLWGIDMADAEWLALDAASMPEESQRRLAFAGYVTSVREANALEMHQQRIDALTTQHIVFAHDLAALLAPPQAPVWDKEDLAYREKHRKEIESAKQSWRTFRQALIDAPEILSAPENLKSWKSGLWRLWDVTRWVKQRSAKSGKQGMNAWKALATVFSPDVEHHYVRGMSLAWRNIRAELPKFTGPNTYSTKHTSILAVDAIELESLAEANWPNSWTAEDAKLATRHITMAGSVRAPYFERIVSSHPEHVLPIVTESVRVEFRSGGRLHDILSMAAHNESSILETAAIEVLRLMKASEPVDKVALGYCIGILQRGLSYLPPKSLQAISSRRIAEHLAKGDEERVFEYLGLLASLDGEAAGRAILTHLSLDGADPDEVRRDRVRKWLGAAFDFRTSGGFASQALQTMSVGTLASHVRLAYRYVHPRDDPRRVGSSTITTHDSAEGARQSLLNALFQRSGPEAHAVFHALSQEPDFAMSSLRFKEIAHRKAQADTEIPAWTAQDIQVFIKCWAAPVKTGQHLLTLTKAVLEGIANDLHIADASSRLLLAMADSEEPVQEWLAERLREKSRERYTTHRENQVASRNTPDITLASSSAAVEVAIEIKNANMGWTLKGLESALRKQLAQDYLLPDSRRHGVLVVSLHRHRTWRVGKEVWEFPRVMDHLRALAATVTANKAGAVVVEVVGFDATSSSTG